MAGKFKAGAFQFPTTTGNYSVTGLGFQPQAMLFFGGNQDTEDTLLHPSAPGLFFGMAWHDVDTAAMDYQSQAQTTYGTRWQPRPITSLSTGTVVEYEADTVTFDANGFTIHVNDAAPGPRLVHWLAWGGMNSEGKTFGSTSAGTNFDVTSLGYRPLSAVAMSMFSTGASRTGSANGFLYLSLGTASFPETDTAGTNDNAQAITFRSTGTTSQGFTQHQHQVLDDGITLSVHSGPAGTYLDDVDHLRPYPNWDSDALRLTLFGVPNRAELIWLDAEADITTVVSPNVSTTNTYTMTIDDIQAVLFFGTTGYGKEEQLGVNYAFTIGVLTRDYQGCVAFDTGHGDAPANNVKSFFQSQAACVASCLSPGGGIRVASGEINHNNVILTGQISSNTNYGNTAMHAWGVPRPGVWLPQIYRRVFR